MRRSDSATGCFGRATLSCPQHEDEQFSQATCRTIAAVWTRVRWYGCAILRATRTITRDLIDPQEHIATQFSDLFLTTVHASTLFVINDDGRLRYIGEPGYGEAELDPAPRFWMGRTLAGNIWRFRYDLPADVVRAVDRLCRSEPVATNLADPPIHADAIRTVLHAHAPVTNEWRGPAYVIPPGVQVPANVVLVSERNADVLEAHFPWKRTSRAGFKHGPVAATIVDGVAVALCFCSRLTEQATAAGVETAEAARRRGYASAAVAGWAAAVHQQGLIPLYSTSWENVASQGVARKLGMVHYGDDWSIT